MVGFQLAVPNLYTICLISRHAVRVMFFVNLSTRSTNHCQDGQVDLTSIHRDLQCSHELSVDLARCVSWAFQTLAAWENVCPLVEWDNLPNMICFNWMWNHHVHNVLFLTCYWTNSWTATMNIPLPAVFLKFWPVHLVSGSSSNPKTENSFFYMVNMIFQLGLKPPPRKVAVFKHFRMQWLYGCFQK